MKVLPCRKASFALLPLLLMLDTYGAIAQVVPAIDGTGTLIKTQNNRVDITGGTQAGGNLFHSFQQFGLNAGQTANFVSNPQTVNILGRVTGGNASLINGILQVSGSNANLFLINPSGIVFGKDASLNLPAAFTATTANGIGFGNGQWLNATGANHYGVLTTNPTRFGFVGLSGSLVNAGNLSVNPGQSIALVGGTVVNTGTIVAPGGNITIAAIPGEKVVRIGQTGSILSLDLPMSDRAIINAPVATPLALPALLTGGSVPSAMGVVVDEGVIRLTAGSATARGVLNADGQDSQSGGNVIAYADNRLEFSGAISAKGGALGGNGGFVDTSGKTSISIAPNATVSTTALNGKIGTWLIDPVDLTVVATGGAGEITAGSNSPAAASTIDVNKIVEALNGNNVNLQADNSITVNAAINAIVNANSGNLTLTAPTVNLNQPIDLRTGSTLNGTATTVNVGASGRVQNGIDAVGVGGTVNLAAATYTLSQTIEIAKDVTVRGAGSSNTTVSGNNIVRVFNINSGTVTLDGMSIVNGNVSADGSTVGDGTVFGDGGGINNNNGTLTVSNSTLSGNSASDYGGGINNKKLLTIINSSFSGNVAIRGGGINNSNSVIVSNSNISGNNATYGGGIFNDIGTMTVNSSTLIGNTAIGFGGGIANQATLRVGNSTLSGNAADDGGGINNNGTITLRNSTLSGNAANNRGGGIKNNSNLMTIDNTIVSGNRATNGREINSALQMTSDGHNLFGYSGTSGLVNIAPAGTDLIPTAPLNQILAPLGNYGGNTKTYALLPGSPAINTGNAASNTFDQRGKARVGTADIGAFESQGFTLAPVAGTPQDVRVGQATPLPLTVKVTANNPLEPIAGGLVNFTAPTSLSTATIATPQAVINASGNASTIATANSQPGSYGVIASVPGVTQTQSFALTNVADVPVPIVPNPAPDSPVIPIVNREVVNREDQNDPKGTNTPPIIKNEVVNIPFQENTKPDILQSQEIPGNLSLDDITAIDNSFSNDFAGGSIDPNSAKNLDGTVLREIEQKTGARPAMVYLRTIKRSATESADSLEFTVLSARGRFRRRIPINYDQFMDQVKQLRREITNPIRTHTTSYLPAAQSLYKTLISPIQSDLTSQEITNLIFLSEPGLRSVPFAALHDGQQFLIEQYSVGLMPSVGLTQLSYQNIQNSSLLMVGVSQSTQNQSALPMVQTELQIISRIWNNSRKYLNDRATRATLASAKQAKDFQIIHLATHANFIAGRPKDAYIQLWNDRLQIDQMKDLEWNRQGLDLLVLSACKTAVGDHDSELGFAGLAVNTGARTAIASLWSVNDTATMSLMSKFYDQLLRTPLKVEALRQAQLAMIRGTVKIQNNQLVGVETTGTIDLPSETIDNNKKFIHPYFWAAFTLVGNPW